MSTLKLPAASGGGSISIKGPASAGSDTDLLDTSGNLAISGTSTLTGNVTAAGTLYVGTTSYGGGGVTPALYVSNSGGRQVKIHNTSDSTCSLQLTNSGSGQGDDNGLQIALLSDDDTWINNQENAHMRFATNGTERLRLTSDGNIFTRGNAAAPTGSSSGFGFTEDQLYISGTGTGDNYNVRFYNGNGLVGSCMTSGSSTTFNTSSDYRLKENIVSLTGAITRIKQLTPKRFNFKANASKTVDGFLAHEAQTVVPEAVSGTKDAVDSDDKIIPQGIDQSKLVPLLTAALQEAIAKIETLETKVAALEAG
jgi:hypothetical protein